MKRIPFLPNVCIAVSLALGITAVGIADTVFVSAQMPEPRPVLELAGLLFEPTVSQHYTYTVGNRRDPFVPLPFSGSLDDSDAPELSNSGNTEGTVTLLGIISGKRGYQALLELPNGERVMVGPGSFLEKTTGRVTRITRNTVVLTRLLDEKDDNQILEKTLVLSN
jgi:hypothetical protein